MKTKNLFFFFVFVDIDEEKLKDEQTQKKIEEKKQISKDDDSKKIHRGIPKALFLNDIRNEILEIEDAEQLLLKVQQQYTKYKLMESSLHSQYAQIKGKIPRLEEDLEMIYALKKKKEQGGELTTQFKVADLVYSTAVVENFDYVSLWLGANVMLEYPIDEAAKLLENNISNAKKTIEELLSDINYLKDQITTTEVTISRVYNHSVKLNRLKKK
ncbi:prefoldin subunit 3 [Anaeramoeba ignava]|uniref:Prefoldin subunit 3 n=1 Tax=Anaeramoeba ignava TaxID=1746090 RepID=A0A9Q0RAY5_ANAIG|nr:prefoldin subunit 3 [Anaeramoeba ignava]